MPSDVPGTTLIDLQREAAELQDSVALMVSDLARIDRQEAETGAQLARVEAALAQARGNERATTTCRGCGVALRRDRPRAIYCTRLCRQSATRCMPYTAAASAASVQRAEAALRLWDQGVRLKVIAERLGVSYQRVQQILRRAPQDVEAGHG